MGDTLSIRRSSIGSSRQVMVEVAEIVVHEADEPNAVVDLPDVEGCRKSDPAIRSEQSIEVTRSSCVHPFLHRVGQPSRAPGRMHGESPARLKRRSAFLFFLQRKGQTRPIDK